MLALAFVVIGFAAKGADYWRLTQEEAALQAQFTQAFQEIQPGNTAPVLDPVGAVSSIKRSLGASTATPVFLASLLELSAALGENAGATVEAITYRAGVVDR